MNKQEEKDMLRNFIEDREKTLKDLVIPDRADRLALLKVIQKTLLLYAMYADNWLQNLRIDIADELDYDELLYLATNFTEIGKNMIDMEVQDGKNPIKIKVMKINIETMHKKQQEGGSTSGVS